MYAMWEALSSIASHCHRGIDNVLVDVLCSMEHVDASGITLGDGNTALVDTSLGPNVYRCLEFGHVAPECSKPRM